MEPQEVMAFWPNNRFPYCLSGTVTEYRPQGLVCTKEFGNGYYFKPMIILPHAEGIEIKAKLDKLAKEYRSELAKLNVEFNHRAMKVAHFLEL